MRQLAFVFILILGAIFMASAPMSPFSLGALGTAGVHASANGARPQPSECDTDTNAVVLKLTPGTNISTINNKYDTQTARSFPGTTIFVVLTSPGAKASTVAAERMDRDKNRVGRSRPVQRQP